MQRRGAGRRPPNGLGSRRRGRRPELVLAPFQRGPRRLRAVRLVGSRGAGEARLLAGGAIARDPEKACPAALASEASGQRGPSEARAPDTRPEAGSSARGLDPGWEPVFGTDHAQTKT